MALVVQGAALGVCSLTRWDAVALDTVAPLVGLLTLTLPATIVLTAITVGEAVQRENENLALASDRP